MTRVLRIDPDNYINGQTYALCNNNSHLFINQEDIRNITRKAKIQKKEDTRP